jgi:hypothetical protein
MTEPLQSHGRDVLVCAMSIIYHPCFDVPETTRVQQKFVHKCHTPHPFLAKDCEYVEPRCHFSTKEV